MESSKFLHFVGQLADTLLWPHALPGLWPFQGVRLDSFLV